MFAILSHYLSPNVIITVYALIIDAPRREAIPLVDASMNGPFSEQ